MKPKKIVVRNKVTLAELKRYNYINCLNDGIEKYSAPSHIVEDPKTKKRMLIIREGVCEPNKCKSVCCKFCHIETDSTYWANFGTKCDKGIRFEGNCKQLDCKNNKCKVWDKKEFPMACKQFPHPNDSTYWEVFNTCSFYYEKVYEVNDLK